MSNIHSISFHEVIRPLKITFATSLGKKDIIKSVIVKIMLDSGHSGIGECPTSLALKDENTTLIKGLLAETSKILTNKPIDEYNKVLKILRSKYKKYPMTISGLEVALFRAWLAFKNKSEHGYWGSMLNDIETDITIPFITDPAILDRWIRYAKHVGFSTFKLKVSGNIEADKTYISRFFDKFKRLSDAFAVRLDGNQGFTERSFFQLIDFIEHKGYNIELFEQPLPKKSYRGFTEIKKHSSIPIILDETILSTQDLIRAIDKDMCHGVNIKVAKNGIDESIKIYSMAKKHGMKLMIGCMTETFTGLSAGIYLALGTGGFDFIDLDAIHFLHHKKHYHNITIEGPRYTVKTDYTTI